MGIVIYDDDDYDDDYDDYAYIFLVPYWNPNVPLA